MTRKLFYGDNLDILKQEIEDETIDLVYLDPPFKSDADYNLLFQNDGLSPDEAQLTAFKDTWLWDTGAQAALAEIQDIPNPSLVTTVNALYQSLGNSPMMAYIVNMALRLYYIRQKLKNTGSLYIHCDPAASHYLRILLDSIFGPTNFRSEIIWRRTGSHNKMNRWAPIHDTIFFYTKSGDYKWNHPKKPYMKGHLEQYCEADGKGNYVTKYYGNVLTGSGTRNGESGSPWKGIDPTKKNRHWAIPSKIWEDCKIDPSGMTQHQKLDALYKEGLITFEKGQYWPIYRRTIKPGEGPAAPDIWSYQPYTDGTVYGTTKGIDADVRWLSPQDTERLGYPTQKPTALLRRIIAASSDPGDLVMDPFCGCGTTISAAEELERKWIGVDISPYAIQLIRRQRIEEEFPYLHAGTHYEISGLPTTIKGAEMLAAQDKIAFQVWAVSVLDGIPNEKKGPDKGIDGRLPFKPDGKTTHYAVISVKGGKLKADDIRALGHVADREKTTSLGFGVLVSLNDPTSKMKADAAAAGMVNIGGKDYQKLQILTVQEILAGKRPNLPLLAPGSHYKKAKKKGSGTSEMFS